MQSDASTIRRRIFSVTACAFLTGLALSGVTVILPLYATNNLGLDNAGYARVLSLRMTGITVAVILLGALSDRFGNKRMTTCALGLGGVCYAFLGYAPLAGFLVLVPVASGLLSTSFVNLNHLTQIADVRRQGRSNTLYRAAGALAGILAPLLMTRFLDSITLVFASVGAGLCAGAFALQTYPLVEPRVTFRGWSQEFVDIVSRYRGVLRQGSLMRFLNLSLWWSSLTSSVGVYFAIRVTRELHAPAASYGNACSIASALTLAGIIAWGAVLDRARLKSSSLWLFGACSLSVIGLGLTQSVQASTVLFVIYTLTWTVVISPMSMWVNRESDAGARSTAFAVHKIMNAVYQAIATLLFSWIEPRLGIRGVFLLCGVLSLGLLAGLSRLREPPRATATRWTDTPPVAAGEA